MACAFTRFAAGRTCIFLFSYLVGLWTLFSSLSLWCRRFSPHPHHHLPCPAFLGGLHALCVHTPSPHGNHQNTAHLTLLSHTTPCALCHFHLISYLFPHSTAYRSLAAGLDRSVLGSSLSNIGCSVTALFLFCCTNRFAHTYTGSLVGYAVYAGRRAGMPFIPDIAAAFLSSL